MSLPRAQHAAHTRSVTRWQRQALRWQEQWRVRAPRERRLILLALGLLLALAIWLLALQPAIQTIDRAQAMLPKLSLDAARASAIALEAQALRAQPQAAQRSTDPIDTATRSTQLQNTLTHAGLAGYVQLTQVSTEPVRWSLLVEQAPAASVLDWLAHNVPKLGLQTYTLELQRSIVEGRERPGYVSGQIDLREGPKP